ncbi:MAG: beta-ketoacyl-ACP synthase III [Saprospiraceae bacterium]
MTKIKAAIKGVGGYLPPDVLSNFDLEKMVDTNDEWIRSRTGIEERRLLKGEHKGTSILGIHAVQNLLEKTGCDPEEIDLLICATVTPDVLFPDTANIIAYKTGLRNAFTFDITAACSGFLFALTTGAKYIESGHHKKVIIVGADKMSSIINYEDRATCIIFGDGAGAVLLEADEENGYHNSYMRSDGSGQEHLYIVAGGSVKPSSLETIKNKEHFVQQNGRAVFKAAVSGMTSAVTEVMKQNNLTVDDVDWLVPHQANIRIIDTVGKMLNFPKEKVMMNIVKYGNTTAGTLPLCLWDYESKLKKGDKIILTAFGGGFTWGASYLTWAY